VNTFRFPMFDDMRMIAAFHSSAPIGHA